MLRFKEVTEETSTEKHVGRMDHNRFPSSRRKSIALLSNHLCVLPWQTDGDHSQFYRYKISITSEDGTSVDDAIRKTMISGLLERVEQLLGKKVIVNDGEIAFFTIDQLPKYKHIFTVTMGSDSRTYNLTITYIATDIPTSERYDEAVRVLNLMLRQNAAKKGCRIVRQSFFHEEPRNFVDIGEGMEVWRGIRSSFSSTSGKLLLNMDVSTTVMVKPEPLTSFLLSNQEVVTPYRIDWDKAKSTLKNLRIKEASSGMEYKITGLSESRCKDQKFILEQRNKGSSDATEVETTVYDYYAKKCPIGLELSGDFPCINVGKPNKATYLPIELCSLVPLQRYTKALSNRQRASFEENSRLKPQERMNALKQAVVSSNYTEDSLLQYCGISALTCFTSIEGRVLAPPKLKVGKDEDFVPPYGSWNFNDKHVAKPTTIFKQWVVVDFTDYDYDYGMISLYEQLARCAKEKGIDTGSFKGVISEYDHYKTRPATERVDQIFEQLDEELVEQINFILCILPERKTCDLYGPFKRNTRYLTNLGGMNSFLYSECNPTPSLVHQVPTLIVGMYVSHGRDVPSIAAVVGSRRWPSISEYKATLRSQLPRSEMIETLFKPISATIDQGSFSELLYNFRVSSHGKPEQIIILNGVSESKFDKVKIELKQIMKACKFRDKGWDPKFVLVVAQKSHHTKFFQSDSLDNVPPGTVIDTGVCGINGNKDFYMCAHASKTGTTRPTHYHVLHNSTYLTTNDLQELVHSLCYVSQTSTTATSLVAPIRYARRAATQMSKCDFEEGVPELQKQLYTKMFESIIY
ncbi:hypothetical protein OROMI_008160 [Orobanche minor]